VSLRIRVARSRQAALLAAFQPDIVWSDPDSLPFGGTYTGQEEVLAFFQKLPEYWRELQVTPDEFVDGGDTIVVLGHHHCVGAKGTFDGGFVHVWRMRDGKAASFTEHTDTARALEALGAPVAAAG
jgi:uncharacterized protein